MKRDTIMTNRPECQKIGFPPLTRIEISRNSMLQ